MSTRIAWRIFGSLGILQIVVLFGGFAFGAPMTELSSSRDQVRKALVDTAQWRGLASVYTELISALVVVVAGILLSQLLRRPAVVDGWIASVVAAAAVLFAGLTIVSAAAGGVTHYDAHHGVSLDVLTTMDHLRDFVFFGSVAALGLLALFAGIAITRTRALSPVLGWLGVIVGGAAIASVAGAIGGLHNLTSLATLVWILSISIAALRVEEEQEA